MKVFYFKMTVHVINCIKTSQLEQVNKSLYHFLYAVQVFFEELHLIFLRVAWETGKDPVIVFTE